MSRSSHFLAVPIAWCIAALTAVVLAAAPTSPSTTTLAVPGRANANVSLAADASVVAAAWSASEPSGSSDVYAAVSRDGGRTFSSPVRVNSTPGDARVNGEQPPRVALIPRAGGVPTLTVVWTSKSQVGTTILFARSDDGGRSFTRSALIPAGEAPGNRGWQNITVDRDGAVRVLWLDHRELARTASPEGGSAHVHAGHDASATSKTDGVATARLSKLYISTIGDEASPRMLLGGVCYCCKTALTTSADNTLYAAWRHVYPGNLRDIAFAISRNGGRSFLPPIRVSEDRWQLEGCPDDGPAMAVDPHGVIHVVWPTLVSDSAGEQPTIGIFYARSSDGGVFTARQRIASEGLAHHPQIAIAGRTLVLAWDELANGSRRVVVGRRPLAASADAPFTRTVVSDSAPGIYPALAPSTSGAVVAWSTNSPKANVIRVMVLP
jgi:hypothetical protein